MIEQMAGVLYVALVIARLVGLTVVRASARAERCPRTRRTTSDPSLLALQKPLTRHFWPSRSR